MWAEPSVHLCPLWSTGSQGEGLCLSLMSPLLLLVADPECPLCLTCSLVVHLQVLLSSLFFTTGAPSLCPHHSPTQQIVIEGLLHASRGPRGQNMLEKALFQSWQSVTLLSLLPQPCLRRGSLHHCCLSLPCPASSWPRRTSRRVGFSISLLCSSLHPEVSEAEGACSPQFGDLERAMLNMPKQKRREMNFKKIL